MRKIISLFLSIVIMATSFMVLPASAFADSVSRVSIHDPSVYKGKDDKHYVVGSHLVMAESEDLVNWSNLGHTMDGYNYLCVDGKNWKENLATPLEWTSSYQLSEIKKYGDDSPYSHNFEYNCWANDVIYNEVMGKYCLYGSCSVWGTTASVIWLATSDCPTGPFEHQKSFIYSGITNWLDENDERYNGLPYTKTNIPEDIIDAGYIKKMNIFRQPWFVTDRYHWNYNGYACGWGDFPNAIDPTAYFDANGEMWLVYGSYSGGCYVIKLDTKTGTPDYAYMNSHIEDGYDVYYGKQISRTNAGTEGTGEGPFIVYDSVNGYYYFFLTYGGLAADGGYNIREYRSKNPDGPYVDAAGFEATDEKNTGLKLVGNYTLPSVDFAYMSGGHSSCLIDDDGSVYQAYHTRFDNKWSNNTEGHEMRVHKMQRTNDGWLLLEPYEYKGNSDITSISTSDILGEYSFINNNNQHQRKEFWTSPNNDIIIPEQSISLNANGTITGAKEYSFSITNTNLGSKAVSGKWTRSGDSVNAVFTIGATKYNVVFTKQYDEADNAKLRVVFTGYGNNNATIWGVKNCNHTVVQSKQVAATYFASGKKGGTYCKTCGAVQSAQTTTKQLVLSKPTVKLATGKKYIKVSWNKNTNATGYQIRYSLKSNMSSSKTITVKSNKTVAYTIKKLTSKKKYYVQVRSYKTNSAKKTVYSSWSSTKNIKVK